MNFPSFVDFVSSWLIYHRERRGHEVMFSIFTVQALNFVLKFYLVSPVDDTYCKYLWI